MKSFIGSSLDLMLSRSERWGCFPAVTECVRVRVCVCVCVSLSVCVSERGEALHQSVFLSAMSAHPSRDLPLCWEQHCKLLPGVTGVQASRVTHWTVQEVRINTPRAARL